MGGLTGFLRTCGQFGIGFGVAFGQGGPAQAIMSTNAIVMTFFTVLLDNQSLTYFEILALCSGIFGAFIISMGDELLQKIKGKHSKVG